MARLIEEEFNILQTLYLKALNELSEINRKLGAGASWQESNSEIENYAFFGITAISGMSTLLITVQTMVQYFDKNYSSIVNTHAQMIFLRKIETAKCTPNPKRLQIVLWTHLNMLYPNPTGSLKFCKFSNVYPPFIV